MSPIFGRKKEPKEVFEENMRKARKLYDSPKRWQSSECEKLLKHIEKAQEIAETVEVDQEDKVWLWSVKGSVFYMGYQRLDEALECYDKALSINPEDFVTFSNKLQVLYGMGKWDGFIEDCDKALELISEARKQIPEGQDPSVLGGTMVLSPTATARRGVDFLDYMESMLWAQKGEALGSLGRAVEAFSCFDKAIELGPNNTEVWRRKGGTMLRSERFSEAMECFDKVLKIDTRNVIAWGAKGEALRSLGKFRESIECYERALKINSTYADAWVGKGTALAKLGKLEKAIRCYEKALEINPTDVEAWYDKGVALQDLCVALRSMRREEWAIQCLVEALMCYDTALEINPTFADAWGNKGAALANLGNPEKAIECYDKALKINPKNAFVWFNKGIALNIMDRHGEAKECFRKAVEIDPSFRDKIKSLSE